MKILYGPFALLIFVAVGCAAHTPLNDAIVAGDQVRVKALLDAGAHIEEQGACAGEVDGMPLECAVRKNSLEMVRILIDRGANPSKHTAGYSPVVITAAALDPEILRYLLDSGVNVESTGIYGFSPLMSAASTGKPEAVRLLIDRGASIDRQTAYGYSPLYLAAHFNRLENARILVANGANVDAALTLADSHAAKETGKTKEMEFAAISLLKELKEKVIACLIRIRSDVAVGSNFSEVVSKYRSQPTKPALPEDARIYRVQAEDAVERKRFQEAVDLYGKALKIAPWWPEGYYNQALVLGENNCYEQAIAAMERYLALVPDSPDARAARDEIYKWKGRVQ